MDPGNKFDGEPFFGGTNPHGTPAPFPMGTVIDDTWIVQSSHGPFMKGPEATPTECAPNSCKSYDHWENRLKAVGVEVGAQGELIADFRSHFGEAKWLAKELAILQDFKAEKGSNAGPSGVTFEDTSADGSSDGNAMRHDAWAGTYSGQGP